MDEKQKVVQFPGSPRELVTQEELLEVLALERLLEEKRARIRSLLEAGADLEPGVHMAELKSISTTSDRKMLVIE